MSELQWNKTSETPAPEGTIEIKFLATNNKHHMSISLAVPTNNPNTYVYWTGPLVIAPYKPKSKIELWLDSEIEKMKAHADLCGDDNSFYRSAIRAYTKTLSAYRDGEFDEQV